MNLDSWCLLRTSASCDNGKMSLDVDNCFLRDKNCPQWVSLCFHRCLVIYRVSFFLLGDWKLLKYLNWFLWNLESYIFDTEELYHLFASSNTGNDYLLLHKFSHHPLKFKSNDCVSFHNSFITISIRLANLDL